MEIISLNEAVEVKFGEVTLVSAKLALPQVAGRSAEARRINAHYKSEMRFWKHYAEKTFAKQAKKQYDYMAKNGFNFNSYILDISYEVTLNDDCTLSLFTDRGEYTGGANGITVRNGDTWQNGFPLHMKIMERRKRVIQRHIVAEIQKRQANDEYYFEPVKKYVRKYYNPSQWYLTENGLTVFYQEITIAPHSSGIVTFQIKEEKL